MTEAASAIPAEIREQVEGIFDGYGFDQGLLFGAVCAALSLKADHIESLEARVATLSAALAEIDATAKAAARYDGDRLSPEEVYMGAVSTMQSTARRALAAREASR